MNAEELEHLQTLLSSPGPIPEPSRVKLLYLLETARSKLAPEKRRAARDAIIRQGAESFGFLSIKARARVLAEQSKRLRSGRRSEYPWITRADKIYPLPGTERMFEKILASNLNLK